MLSGICMNEISCLLPPYITYKHELIGCDKKIVFLIFCFSVYKPWKLCREVFTDNLRPSVPTERSI